MVLLYTALIFAVMEWYFEYKQNKLGIYLTKPTMMIFFNCLGMVLCGCTQFDARL